MPDCFGPRLTDLTHLWHFRDACEGVHLINIVVRPQLSGPQLVSTSLRHPPFFGVLSTCLYSPSSQKIRQYLARHKP
jgi:hypothetical protein